MPTVYIHTLHLDLLRNPPASLHLLHTVLLQTHKAASSAQPGSSCQQLFLDWLLIMSVCLDR